MFFLVAFFYYFFISSKADLGANKQRCLTSPACRCDTRLTARTDLKKKSRMRTHIWRYDVCGASFSMRTLYVYGYIYIYITLNIYMNHIRI